MLKKSVTLYDDQYKFFKELKSEKLLVAFVEFMFENIEPEGLNSLEQTVFDSLRMRMDSQKQKARAGAKGGASSHGGGRSKKQAEEQAKNKQKNKQKTSEKTSKKQAKNKEEISKDILRDISNDISKDEGINNLTSNDVKGTSSKEYGDPEINECLEIIKSFNEGIIDGTQKQNRIDAKNLIGKIKKIPSVANGDFIRQDTLRAILEIISQNKFYSPKINSPGSIFHNFAQLIQVCKQEGLNKIQTIPIL